MSEAERNLTSDLDAEVMPAPRRMPSIDFDEALAMFFVVLYHSHYYTTNFVEYGASAFPYYLLNGLLSTCVPMFFLVNGYLLFRKELNLRKHIIKTVRLTVASAFPYYLLNGLLSTCVPMFFLVNGYLLFRKELNLRKHIIKTVRLTVVTIIWSFIIPVVLCPITGYEPTIKELLSWGWYRTMGWNDQLWFIGALVCIYIFFPILKVAYDKYRPAFLFFVAVCAIMTFGVVVLNQVISVVLCGLFSRGSLFDFNYFASFDPFRGIHGYSFVYFCLGGLLWDKRDALLKRAPNKRVALAVATLVISSALLAAWGWLASSVNGKLFDTVYHGYDTVFVLANTLALFVLGLSYQGKAKIPHRFILAVSQNTLGILYVHNMVRVTLNLLVDSSGALTQLCSNLIGSVFYALIILSISLGIVCILKKIPVLKQLV